MGLKGINAEQKLFLIHCGNGFTTLGFDRCLELTTKLAGEFTALCTTYPEVFAKASPFMFAYGTEKAYAEYERLCKIGRELNEKTRWRSQAELTPQLIGLEGYRVEVVDCYGDKRKFQVGKSTGWMPCHIELKTSRSHDGPAVIGAPFKSLQVLTYNKEG